jgi:hypothetical protein
MQAFSLITLFNWDGPEEIVKPDSAFVDALARRFETSVVELLAELDDGSTFSVTPTGGSVVVSTNDAVVAREFRIGGFTRVDFDGVPTEWENDYIVEVSRARPAIIRFLTHGDRPPELGWVPFSLRAG